MRPNWSFSENLNLKNYIYFKDKIPQVKESSKDKFGKIFLLNPKFHFPLYLSRLWSKRNEAIEVEISRDDYNATELVPNQNGLIQIERCASIYTWPKLVLGRSLSDSITLKIQELVVSCILYTSCVLLSNKN